MTVGKKWRVLGTVAVLGWVHACSVGSEVLVGKGAGLGLGTCQGEHTHCDDVVASKDLPRIVALQCDTEPVDELEVDWEVTIEPDLCKSEKPVKSPDDEKCRLAQQTLALGADGSVWATVTYWVGPLNAQTSTGVWLGHYSASGQSLGGAVVVSQALVGAGQFQFDSDITVDSRGHVIVAVYEHHGGIDADDEVFELVVVNEYDEHGEPTGAPISLNGIARVHVAVDSNDTLVLAANASHNRHYGVLASLGSDGRVRFSQNGLKTYGQGQGAGVSGLVVDGEGRSSALMERNWKVGEGARFALTQLDADGNVVWDRRFETPFAESYLAALAVDSEGNLLTDNLLPEVIANDGSMADTGYVQKVSARGELLWATEVPGQSWPVLAVEPAADGRVFAAGAAHHALVEISSDGSRCIAHAVPDSISEIGAMRARTGGEISFISSSNVGRFKPIPAE